MDEFQYTAKLAEMKSLTTKKAKAAFIKASIPYRYVQTSYYDVMLLISMKEYFTDTTITHVKGLTRAISGSIPRLKASDTEIKDLMERFPKGDTNARYNSFSNFMYSNDIAARYKLAILLQQP